MGVLDKLFGNKPKSDAEKKAEYEKRKKEQIALEGQPARDRYDSMEGNDSDSNAPVYDSDWNPMASQQTSSDFDTMTPEEEAELDAKRPSRKLKPASPRAGAKQKQDK